MPDGDVSVRYELIPTEDSIRKASEKIVSNINSGFKKGFSDVTKDAAKKFESVKRYIPGGEALQRQIAPIGEVMKTAQAGFAGAREAGAGVMGAAQAGMAAGGEAAGGMGGMTGMLGGIAGGIAALGPIMLAVAAATAIVAAFFEAVGPIIKVLSKVMTAIFLILLAPILRLLLPVMSQVIQALIGAASFLAKIEEAIIGGVVQWLKSIWNSLVGVMTHLGKAFQKLSEGDIGGFLLEMVGAVIDWLLAYFKMMVGPLIFGIGKLILDNLPAILSLFTDAINLMIGIVAGTVSWIGESIFGKETWNAIKASVYFIKDSVFGKAGLWDTIAGTVNYIKDVIFAKGGVWDLIKLALDEAYKMLTTKWTAIIGALGQIADLLKPLVDLFAKRAGTAVPEVHTDVKATKQTWDEIAKKNDETNKMLSYMSKQMNEPKVAPKGMPAAIAAISGYTDFISRPGTGIQSFSPSDTVIGTKGAGGGAVVINNTFNIDSAVDKTELKKILSDFAREQGRELRMRTSYISGVYA